MAKNEGTCKDWSAWHDTQPTGPATLHVVGKCKFPTSGYKVELKVANPQGINLKIRLLDKVVHAPSVSNPVETGVDVHFKEVTDEHYESVQIQPDGVIVPVKEVS